MSSGDMLLRTASSSAPFHGVKAIREIRSNRTEPSDRLNKKISDTHNYFYEKVDPIIGECITYLLCEKPTDVARCMLTFLEAKKKGKTLVPNVRSTETSKLKARKDLKQYLAVSIGPVIAKVVNRVAIQQPADVLGFISEELASMIQAETDPTEPDPLDENINPPATITSTAKSANQHSDAVAIATAAAAGAPVSADTVAHLEQYAANAAKAAAAATAAATATAGVEKEPRILRFTVLGLSGAGKSSILATLQGHYESIPSIKPTHGFRPTTMMLGNDTQIRFYDVSGADRFRKIWEHYLHDIHGLVYVVDASSSKEQVEASLAEYRKTMENSMMATKPLLLLANKADKEGTMKAKELRDLFRLAEDSSRQSVCMACSSFVPEDMEPDTFSPDPSVEAAIAKLLEIVNGDYDRINGIVEREMAIKAEEETKARMDRERKVLKSKIASAFAESIAPDILSTLKLNVDPETMLGEKDGNEFLSAEVGEDVAGLPLVALQIAEGVGYQKLALQMCGAFRAPIKKGKVPMSWEEIHTIVCELRVELGLKPIV